MENSRLFKFLVFAIDIFPSLNYQRTVIQ
jgi:hypothetical protein